MPTTEPTRAMLKFRAKRLRWGLLFVLFTVVAGICYAFGARYLAAQHAAHRALEEQSEVDATLSLLKDAETGHRGYLLTGNDAYVEPYRAAQVEVPEHLARLRHVLRKDSKQLDRLDELEGFVKGKLAFIEETLQLRHDEGLHAVIPVLQAGRGLQLMNSIRSVWRDMNAETQGVVRARREEMHQAEVIATWGIGVSWVLLMLLSRNIVRHDMRQLRRSAAKLAEREQHFRLVTENSNDLVRLVDLHAKTTYVSPSVERLLGYSVAEFLALPALAMVHPDDREITHSIVANDQVGSIEGGQTTYRMQHKSGEYLHFEVRWSPYRNAAGEIVGVHTAARDVTERMRHLEQLREQAERLRSLSLRDELTKLYNRRGFLEVATQARLQAERDARSAALIFVDLNGMKRINDELGHDMGDAALRDAAQILSKALAKSDVLARLGGDEFAAFALDFSEANLDALRLRLRALSDAVVIEQRRPFRLSMSVGAAYAAPGSALSLEQLLEHADAAMYEAKRARQLAGGISLQPRVKLG